VPSWARMPAWIYVLGLGAAHAATHSPLLAKNVIATDAPAMSHYTLPWRRTGVQGSPRARTIKSDGLRRNDPPGFQAGAFHVRLVLTLKTGPLGAQVFRAL
jgi:hypothetical protein